MFRCMNDDENNDKEDRPRSGSGKSTSHYPDICVLVEW
jgi:hypothetical protein